MKVPKRVRILIPEDDSVGEIPMDEFISVIIVI